MLKDTVVGLHSAHWTSRKDCLRNICTLGLGYKRAKCYYRAEFDAPGASAINEIKSTKNPGLCFQ